jgi:hypothetical protein
MKRYRSSGSIPFGGFIALILATIIGSLVIGGIVFAVSHLFYLIILFPLLMGAVGGSILLLVVKSSKVRSPIIAGLFGLLMGVGIIGVNHFLTYYITDRNDFRSLAVEQYGDDISQEELDSLMDEILIQETGSPGFIGDLKFNAQLGTTITRSSSSSEVTLDERATWIYWGVELLIVMGIAAGMAMSAARQPFNEEAGEWYPEGQRVGSVDWKSRKDFYKLLKNGDLTDAFKMVMGAISATPRVDIIVQRTASAPQSDVILTVKETRLTQRRETSGDKMKGVLSAQEYNDMTRTLTAAQGAQSTSAQLSNVAG